MKRWRTAAASLGAVVATLAFASVPSGAEQAAVITKCRITAQPWRGHYNLSVELTDGSTVKLIDAEQHDRYETPPESFDFEVGEVAYVLWAQTKYPAKGHDSWGDVLQVHPSECRWADGVTYHAMPHKRDSVVIGPVEQPAPTTTTTSTTSAPTTSAPPVTTEPTVPPSTVVELPPAEETTTTTEPPAASGHDEPTPDTPVQVIAPPTPFPFEPPVTNVPPEAGREPVPEPTTTTAPLPPSLPVTGSAWLFMLLKLVLLCVALGLAFIVMSGGHLPRRHAEDRPQG